MKISACYIVRNEEKNIENNLKIMQNLVDEIIIVDTGSTDSTIKIAQNYDVQIFNYKWQNDFAAARNFALSKSTGKWIIFLDADEFIIEITKENLINLLLENDKNDILLIKLVNIDASNNNQYIDEFWAPRIFKNSNDIKYRGIIHEQLIHINEKFLKINTISENIVKILHTGYSTETITKKAKRNLMLLKNLPDNEQTAMSLIELAEAYNLVGDKNNALKYSNMAIAKGRQNITYASRPYRILISLLEEQKADRKVIKKAVEIAMYDFPELPDFFAEYAKNLSLEYEYEQAITYMQQAIKKRIEYEGIEPSLFNNVLNDIAIKSIEKWHNIVRLATNIKISVCGIVKNEEKNIQKWYKYAQKYADEIIVVDTGSTDNTIKILDHAAISLYYYQWHNDFAAAKNFALDKANGDWVVFLDADEYFSNDSIMKVRKTIAKNQLENDDIDGILCLKINIDVDSNNEISRMDDLRIFRNKKNLYYQGNIHEQLFKNNEIINLKKDQQIIIYHTGYSTKLSYSKAKRNLAILLAGKYHNNEVPWHYLADCYYGLGEFEKSIKCVKKYLEQDYYYVQNGENNIWRNYINAMILLKKPQQEIFNIIMQAIEKFPNYADFYGFAGIFYFKLGKYRQAKKYLLQAKAIFNKYNKKNDQGTSFAADLPKIEEYLQEIAEFNIGKKIKISACTIAKNSENDIKKWLESIKKINCDEIIVVDTGSVDKTVEIAKAAGAVVYNFKWQEDFAAAKNFALNKADGNWIIFLDTDEYFADGTDIKSFIKNNIDENIDTISCCMINIDMENSGKELNRFMQLRIFRNSPDIFYEGKIHEQLKKRNSRLKIIAANNVVIYHTGYSQNKFLQKMQRNLKMLNEEICSTGEKDIHYRYLADCYYALEKYTKAIDYYQKHLQTGLKSENDNESEIYFNLIDAMVREKYDYKQILATIEIALSVFKDYPEFFAQAGAIYFSIKRYDMAKKNFEKAMEVYKKAENKLRTSNFRTLLTMNYTYLAQIYFYENNMQTALAYIDKVLAKDRFNYKNLCFLIDNFTKLGIKEIKEYLAKYYQEDVQDISFISEQCFAVGNIELFKYYSEYLARKFSVYTEKWKAWQLIMTEDKNKTVDNLLMQAVEKIQSLAVSILLMNELDDKYQNVLPEKIWNNLSAYYNKSTLTEDDFDGYISLLPVVSLRTDDKILQRYINMGKIFSLNSRCKIADILCGQEKWQQIKFFLADIVRENNNINYIFLQGKAAYYSKEWELANKCFKQAIDNDFNKEEAKSYLVWIEDRIMGKW